MSTETKAESAKEIKPQYGIIEKALTLMILILLVDVAAPYILSASYSKDVALIAMLLEKELPSEFWIIISALVSSLGIKQIQKKDLD